jgi:hypothetical protein
MRISEGFLYILPEPADGRRQAGFCYCKLIPQSPDRPCTVFGMIRDALMAIFIAVTAVATAELVVWVWTL